MTFSSYHSPSRHRICKLRFYWWAMLRLVYCKYCDKIPHNHSLGRGALDVSVDEGGSVHITGFHFVLYLCDLKNLLAKEKKQKECANDSECQNEIFRMAKQMVKERQDITGLNCTKGASEKVIVDDKGNRDSWKEYMEKLMNEENIMPLHKSNIHWVPISPVACIICVTSPDNPAALCLFISFSAAVTSSILIQSAGPALTSADILWSHSFSSFISFSCGQEVACKTSATYPEQFSF